MKLMSWITRVAYVAFVALGIYMCATTKPQDATTQPQDAITTIARKVAKGWWMRMVLLLCLNT